MAEKRLQTQHWVIILFVLGIVALALLQMYGGVNE